MSAIGTMTRDMHGNLHGFTAVRQKQIRNGERRANDRLAAIVKGKPLPTLRPISINRTGLHFGIHPALTAAAAMAVKGLAKLDLLPVATVAAPVAPSEPKPTPPPSASSDTFKALMVGIVNAPKQVTKTDLIGYAGTYNVKVVKSWTKDKILSVMAEACGLTYTP